MRRWNGWGSEGTEYPMPDGGQDFLQERIGAGHRLPDAALDTVISQVPASRLPEHPLIDRDAETRVRSRGVKPPDWLAMRSGEFGVFPDGVAFPESAKASAASLLRPAKANGW